jgi:hypothetical protein
MSDVWSAYLTTVIEVTLPDGTQRTLEQTPEQTSQEWPFAEPVAWILTACNPRSEVLSPEVNAERHADMGSTINALGLVAYPNVGYDPDDPTWNEVGYTIVGSDESTVCDIARQWEQNAIFRWSPDGFELVGVLMPGRHRHGWRWITA